MRFALVGACILAAVPCSASSAAPVALNDAQCVLLTNALNQQKQDPAAQRLLFAAHFYYLGRLRAVFANDKLPAILADAAKGIVPSLSGKAMAACASEMQEAEAGLATASKSLRPQTNK